MFDVSFSEITLTAVIGLLILGPKEFLQTAKAIKNWLSEIRTHVEEYTSYLTKELNVNESTAIQDILYDEAGKAHTTYNIEKLKADLKRSAND